MNKIEELLALGEGKISFPTKEIKLKKFLNGQEIEIELTLEGISTDKADSIKNKFKSDDAVKNNKNANMTVIAEQTKMGNDCFFKNEALIKQWGYKSYLDFVTSFLTVGEMEEILSIIIMLGQVDEVKAVEEVKN